MKVNRRILEWVRRLRRNLLAIWFACQHPATPVFAKMLAVLVAGYAFSPIDLIPDVIPILGYLDEFVLLPAAVYVIFKLIPKPVLAECQARADAFLHSHQHTPRNYVAALVIVLIWVGLLAWLWAQYGSSIVRWIDAALD